jgi:hypothetical protein
MRNSLIPAYVLAAFLPTYTAVAPGATVDYVTTSCDAVVVGNITSRTETPTNVSFDIAVQRVLKGTAMMPASAHISLCSAKSSYDAKSRYGNVP